MADAAQVDSSALEQLLDFYGFLVQANGLVARADDIGKLYEDICRLGILLDRRLVLAWIGMIDAPDAEVRVVAAAGPAAAYLEDIHILGISSDERGRGPTGRALREGCCVIVNRFLQDPSTTPWHERARQFGIAASVAIPLRRDDQVCGTLMLYANAPDVFDERIAGELEVLSQTLSYAIDRASEREAKRLVDMQLQESRQALRAILDATHQTILMIRPEGETLAINRSGAARLGLSPQEVIGRNMFELLPPAVAQARQREIGEAVRSGKPVLVEDERDGRAYRATVYPLLEGTPRVVVYAEDMTEQRQAERAAREADRHFREVVDLASEGILSMDLAGKITFANPRMHQLLGVETGCLLGRQAGDFLAEAHRSDFSGRLKRVRDGIRQGPLQVTYRLRDARGKEFPALISAAVKDGNGTGDEGLVAVVADISEMQRVETALRQALRVVEASPVVCFRWRAEAGWPVDYVSPNVARWGWPASALIAGTPSFSELVHPDDLPRVAGEVARHTAAGAVEYVQEYRLRKPDGSYFWVEDSTRVLRDEHGVARFYEGVVADVDAARQHEQQLATALEAQRALNQKLENAQNQLLQSEKMASIGQLAAGVAHEINNPIGFVTSNLGSLGNYLRDLFTLFDIVDGAAASATNAADFDQYRAARAACDLDFLRQDILQLLDESKEGLGRVRKIVQDLKDFSRVGETEWQWADLHPGLDATLNIVWNELKYKCTVRKEYGSLPQVFCLPSQLNQVFMNLLVNAGHAIEDKGEIVIRTEMAGPETVRVSISDTGRGIPAEHLGRIFEPFFTTKPVGSGTGLGLSLAWSIVHRHGGKIEVASTVGQGTTFTVTLPVQPVALEEHENKELQA